jgi:hypothetical protein
MSLHTRSNRAKVANVASFLRMPPRAVPRCPPDRGRGTFGDFWQPDQFGNVKRIPQVLATK